MVQGRRREQPWPGSEEVGSVGLTFLDPAALHFLTVTSALLSLTSGNQVAIPSPASSSA